MAAQLEVIHECVLAARKHPEIYLPPEPAQELVHREYLQFAERSAVFDLSLRLRRPSTALLNDSRRGRPHRTAHR